MFLYHYRSIENALLEIGNGTFHFAAREKLNDPIEGYVRVFWQGDKAAWEGLLRNYICSVSKAIDLYLLGDDENILRSKTLVEDIHSFDNVPYGGILKDLGDIFLADEEIQQLTSFYGKHELKVQEKELKLLIHFINNKALALCIKKCSENNTIQKKVADNLLAILLNSKNPSLPFDLLTEELSDSEHRAFIAKKAEDIIEDMSDYHYVNIGFSDESFLYGKNQNLYETEARQRRNWMSVIVDFPKVYVDQLKEMIYPKCYVACFSGKNDDSSMWGNYADNHRGVCLVYETNEKKQMMFEHEEPFDVKPITYQGNLLECNFFETLGRFTRDQVKTWLTGVDGVSRLFNSFNDVDAWRNRYWSVFEAKCYRKLQAWEHENEYRLVLTDSFLENKQEHNLKYDPKSLKGLIFGIRTSEYDKKRIMEKLIIHEDEYVDFSFYQAEYDDEAQKILVRKKAFWELK